jgi:rod shape-determining protein MreC
MKVSRSSDSFLTIRVRPSADLSKLEEVLVITQREERAPAVAQTGMRAADILAMRLPSVPQKPAEDPKKPGTQVAGTSPTENKPPSGNTSAPKAQGEDVKRAAPAQPKPATPVTSTPSQEKPQ